MDDDTFPIIIFWIFIGATVGGLIGASRNNAGAGILFGALLGPIGWLLVLFLDHRPKCPACQNPIPDNALRCGHCGFDFRASKPTMFEFNAALEMPAEPEKKKCPFCAELIQQEAIKCRYCGSDLPTVLTTTEKEQPIQTKKSDPVTDINRIAAFGMAGDPRILCPLCGKQIRAATLKQGENFCPHCFEKFNAE